MAAPEFSNIYHGSLSSTNDSRGFDLTDNAPGLSAQVRNPYGSFVGNGESRSVHEPFDDQAKPPPGLSGQVHNIYSVHGLEVASSETNAPGISTTVHDNNSESALGSTTVAPINQADYVGISLVGKRFKEVNPTAYYVEKNDNSSF